MRTRAIALCLFLVIGLTHSFAHGQGNTVAFPDKSWTALSPSDVSAHPDFKDFQDVFGSGSKWESSSYYKSYWKKIEPDTLLDVFKELVCLQKILADSPHFDAGNGPQIRANLMKELDDLLSAFGDEAGELFQRHVTWENVKKIIGLDNFQKKAWRWQGAAVSVSTAPEVRSNTVFFPGKPTQIVLMVTQGGLSFKPFRYYATLPQAIEVRAVCDRVLFLFNKAQVEQLDVTVARLGEINRAWDNYLSKGYSQYPWESLANSWLVDFSWSRPPLWQWVVAHPEVSTVFDVRSSSSAQIEPSMAIHALGIVRYFGDDRRWFLGASSTVSITGDPNFGLGVGPTLHFGHANLHSRLPHLSLSVLWHDFETGSHGPVLGLSIDLWRLVSKAGDAGVFRKSLTGGE